MGESNWGCFKQTAVGCGGLIVLAIALPVVLAVMVMVPMNRAVGFRTEIEAAFGTQDSFVPPASGAPLPARIEAFLEVRRALTPSCGDFWNAEQAVARMDAFDSQENVSKLEVIGQALSTSKTMMGMGSLISHYYESRNRALLANRMGLGEYTYIYVVAYRDEIIHPGRELHLFGPEATNKRVRKALFSMMRNQLQRLQEEGGTEESSTVVAAEIEALENDPGRIPWQDGLPPAIDEALRPYREELDPLFCGATMPLELMINEKRTLAIETL